MFLSVKASFSKIASKRSNSSLSSDLLFLSFTVFENNDLPISTPWLEGLAFNDV